MLWMLVFMQWVWSGVLYLTLTWYKQPYLSTMLKSCFQAAVKASVRKSVGLVTSQPCKIMNISQHILGQRLLTTQSFQCSQWSLPKSTTGWNKQGSPNTSLKVSFRMFVAVWHCCGAVSAHPPGCPCVCRILWGILQYTPAAKVISALVKLFPTRTFYIFPRPGLESWFQFYKQQ